ncbi:hypothetical protein P7C70_g7395, partial [Phenoliferia sp. Uapishka_3]
MSSNLVYDSDSTRIPGTLSYFKKILGQFIAWINDDTSSESVNHFKSDLAASVASSRLTPNGQGDILDYWGAVVDTIASLPSTNWEDLDLSELHPLVTEALLTNGIDFMDDEGVCDEWFVKAGTYRRNRPGSRASSRGPKDDAGTDGALISGEEELDGNDSSTATPTPPARQARKFHLNSETEDDWRGISDSEAREAEGQDPGGREAAAPDKVETVGSLLKRCGGPALSSRIGPKSGGRRHNPSPPRKETTLHPPSVPKSKTIKEGVSARLAARARLSPAGKETSAVPRSRRPTPRPAPRHRSRARRSPSISGSDDRESGGYGSDSGSDSFFDNVEAAIRLPYQDDNLANLPRHVCRTKRNKRKFRQLTKHGKGGESIYSIVQRITSPMDYSDIVKTLYGEHINLAMVYHYSPGSTFDIAPAFEELFTSITVTKKSTVKHPPLTFSQWVLSFDVWADLVTRFYPERKEELRRWKALVVRKASRASDQTQARIIRWESRCREEITIVGGVYRWLDEVDTNGKLYIKSVKSASPSTTGSSTTTRSAGTSTSAVAATESIPSSNAGKLLASMLPLSQLLGSEEDFEDNVLVGYLNLDMEPFLPLGDSEEVPDRPLAKAKPPPRGHALSGVGVAPKLWRKFHWPPPEQDPPRTPLLTSTYSARPLPRPSKVAFDDPLAQAVKCDFPHLFREAPVLNVDGFREGLKDHPNRPWVDSLLWGLQHGFWPCHNGLPLQPPPTADMRKYPEREADLVVIEKQVNSDVAAGWTSPGYRSLPKGWLFVFHQDDKDRVVNDQTKNGLNDGVDRADAPAIYDGVRDLIRLLRSLDLANLSGDVILWKLDWKKALFGRVLTVTGIVVNLDLLTVSLPPAAVEKFALEVDDFLSFKGRNPPLRRWRHIAGWANWALGVRPLARPLLSPVYVKLGRPDGKPKNASYAGVFLNKPVEFSLLALVADLRTSDALSLLDPGLTEWDQSDADIVVYTDACLLCDDKTGSGFGFWFDYQGQRRHYYSRVPYSFQRIPFAEGITVAAAIKEIVNLKFPGIQRVMVRTDSSPVVYAYDAGAAQDTIFSPMRTLLLRSFIDIRKGKFDLRALHVSGKDNELADDLSRLHVKILRRLFGASLYFFDLPMEYAGGAGVYNLRAICTTCQSGTEDSFGADPASSYTRGPPAEGLGLSAGTDLNRLVHALSQAMGIFRKLSGL